MGTVYLAEQTTMGRLVALKVLPSSLTQDITFSERFMSEVRTQGALNHPNIATAYDAGAESTKYSAIRSSLHRCGVSPGRPGGISVSP